MAERARPDDTAGVIAEIYSLGTGLWTMTPITHRR